MKKSISFTILACIFMTSMNAQIYLPSGLKGHWTFDNASDLTHATAGTDLQIVGTQTAITGPAPGDGAVRIPAGSYYRCFHNIAANGAGSPTRVNNYSLLFDFRVNSVGQWYTFYQTTPANNDDGDFFISTGGNLGVSGVGYSAFSVTPGQWYRMVITASMGNHFDCYIDGHIVLSGTYQAPDGRFSLDPQSGSNELLFFADDNGEDNEIDIARAAIFDHDLTAVQIDSIGGLPAYSHYR